MNKINSKNIILSSFLIISILGVGLYTNIIKLPIIRKIQPLYIADFTNDKILMGASHNVFVGKVLEQKGDKNLGNSPETQFAVDVLYNVKGDLQGTVVVDQEGGYKNGILYVIDNGDVLHPENNQNNYRSDFLLQPGITYLFATRYNEVENWHTLISHSNGKKIINKDNTLSENQLEILIKNDEKVKKLQEAYKNEILLEVDVINNNARNSYQSLLKK